jgi:uncharacterized RDD family membrane protein YckC
MSDSKTEQAPPIATSYGRSVFGVAPYRGAGPLERSFGDEATLSSRLYARMLDWLALLISAAPGIPLLLHDGDVRRRAIAMTVMCLSVLILCSYQWYQIVNRGQTIGKRALGIKVVKLDGRPVSLFDGVILREWSFSLIGAIPIIGRLFNVLDFAVILASERRCLHDILAKTKVVKVHREAPIA